MGTQTAANDRTKGRIASRYHRDRLITELEAWEVAAMKPLGAFRNQQFLAMFAFFLVRECRAEEDRLLQKKSSALEKRRAVNFDLVRRVAELIVETNHGKDVTEGIRAFLTAWRCHQPTALQPNNSGH